MKRSPLFNVLLAAATMVASPVAQARPDPKEKAALDSSLTEAVRHITFSKIAACLDQSVVYPDSNFPVITNYRCGERADYHSLPHPTLGEMDCFLEVKPSNAMPTAWFVKIQFLAPETVPNTGPWVKKDPFNSRLIVELEPMRPFNTREKLLVDELGREFMRACYGKRLKREDVPVFN